MQRKQDREAAELFLEHRDNENAFVSAMWNKNKSLRMNTIRRKWRMLKALHDLLSQA